MRGDGKELELKNGMDISPLHKKDGGEERAGSARLPPAVPHVVRHKDKGERQKLQTTMRRLQFANGLCNRLTHYEKKLKKVDMTTRHGGEIWCYNSRDSRIRGL